MHSQGPGQVTGVCAAERAAARLLLRVLVLVLAAVLLGALSELCAVQSEVREGLLIELPVRLDVLAFLKLPDRRTGSRAPTSVYPANLVAVLVQRALHFSDLVLGQLLRLNRLLIVSLILFILLRVVILRLRLLWLA